MIGLDNFINYIYNKKDFANLQGIKAFLNDVDNMHLFYNKILENASTSTENTTIKPISIPFQNVWIEFHYFIIKTLLMKHFH